MAVLHIASEFIYQGLYDHRIQSWHALRFLGFDRKVEKQKRIDTKLGQVMLIGTARDKTT